MAVKTTIRQFRTDIPYSISLVYNRDSSHYGVVFASLVPEIQHEESRWFDSYGSAWDCFDKNVFYYNGIHPSHISEEDFHGLPKGTLYPSGKARMVVA